MQLGQLSNETMTLQRVAGLRAPEAAMIRGEDLNAENYSVRVVK
jgi:hypothetical protein